MTKQDVAKPTVSVSEETQSPVAQVQPQYIETSVYGRDETGLTVIADNGKGTFFPDSGTIVPKTPIGKVRVRSPSSVTNEMPIPLDALYPQWQEGRADAGIAIRLVSQALRDLQKAVESACGSSAEMLNYFVLAETQLFQATEKSRFNKAFEIVVSFCAWGIRGAELSTQEPPSIQGMCAALREIQDRPFLNIERATTIILDLERQGWSGESPISRAFQDGLSAFDNTQEDRLLE